MTDFTLLHTSDWHLGHHLYKRRREDEFLDFIVWLCGIIKENNVDVVIIAGDIFDSATPGPAIQGMYFDFLLRMAKAGAHHIIVTAGNHDSPTLLSASSPILEMLDIHVMASIPENLENAIKLIFDKNGDPMLIVCALPYIQEKEARACQPGESQEDREKNLIAGIKYYYDKAAEAAEKTRNKLDPNIPIIATGHLFTSGATISEEERELYIGSLGAITANIFPSVFDYIALGHIHRAQKIGKTDRVHYSGSPLALSFSEATHRKSINLVHFHNHNKEITQIIAPPFRTLTSIHGNREAILQKLKNMVLDMAHCQKPVWLEINHDGQENPANLREDVNRLIAGTTMELLCLKTAYKNANAPLLEFDAGLEDLMPEEIFKLLLKESSQKQDKSDLIACFRELLIEMNLPTLPGIQDENY